MREKLRDVLYRYRHGWILSYLLIYLAWFAYLEQTVTRRFHVVHMAVQDYYKLCIFLFVGMTVFLVASTVYPNGHCLRPRVIERDNIFVDMVKALYLVDTPTNLFPSIHVYNSIGVHISIMQSKRLKGKKWLRRGSFVLMASIVAATMFLKQHSVFDVLTGVVMAAVMYTLVYGFAFQASGKRVYERRYREI